MREQSLYIADIIAAINFAKEFVHGMTFDEFLADEKTRSAVVQKLLIIGEASKNLDVSTQEIDLSVPWKLMAGMRDRLVHGYFGTDYAIVWRVIHAELSRIGPKLEPILRTLEQNSGTK